MTTTLEIQTSRFGQIGLTDEDIVAVPDGLLGFPADTRYVVIEHKEGSPFRWLQSVDSGELAFLVVDPATYVPDYAPEMPDSLANFLELKEETPRLVYTIVTIPRGRPEDMTLNLAGPIVVNLETRTAKQIVLENDIFPIRCPIGKPKAEGGQAA